jgi:thioredoxin 2
LLRLILKSLFTFVIDIMKIPCPHCHKTNQLAIERLASQPICGACKKDLLSAPLEVDEQLFSELTAQSPLPVVVDFWASWCGPCKMFAPTFQASALKHTNEALYVKVNTEENQALSQRLSIRSIPTLAAYSKGKELTRVSGALPAPSLEQFVQKAMQDAN